MAPRRVAFVTSGIRSLSGGIAAVNENILIVLRQLVSAREITLEVDSLLEDEADRPQELPGVVPFRGYRGSKPRLAARTWGHAAAGKWILYERVGLAAATAPLAAAGVLRSVVFAHGSENWRRVRRVDLASLRGADLVITNSHYTRRRIEDYPPLTGRVRAEVCELGLSPAFPLHEAPPSDDGQLLELTDVLGGTQALGARVLLLVGRMDPSEREKGHDQMIAALPAVLARFPDVQLIFAGPGDDRPRLEALARHSGAGAAIFFPGRVSNELLSRLYRRCYAFTMPSRQEGFGLVYLEAMNHGKACLGCREDGAEDVIVHGETGLLIDDPFDIAALSRALCTLLGRPDLARAFGLAGFRRLHQFFAPERFRSRFLDTFTRAIA